MVVLAMLSRSGRSVGVIFAASSTRNETVAAPNHASNTSAFVVVSERT